MNEQCEWMILPTGVESTNMIHTLGSGMLKELKQFHYFLVIMHMKNSHTVTKIAPNTPSMLVRKINTSILDLSDLACSFQQRSADMWLAW